MRFTSSTSEAVDCCVSRICWPDLAASSDPATTCVMVLFTVLIVSAVSIWMLFTSCAICCVAWRELSARRCTSSATTAKPRPASPAAAACIEAFNASTCVRSAIVLMRFTMPVISCERSPRRLIRFSASAMDSRMPSMPRTVSFTEPSAVTVDVVACSAARLDAAASSATCVMTLFAFARFSLARSTSERSAAAVAFTDSAWRFTRSVESFTCAAMLVTSESTRPVSWASRLMESDTVPITLAVTGALAVRSLLESCATACRSCTTELLRSSFSRSASARRATRSSSRLSKARDSWPNSSSPPSCDRAVKSPSAMAVTVSWILLMGRVTERSSEKAMNRPKPSSATAMPVDQITTFSRTATTGWKASAA